MQIVEIIDGNNARRGSVRLVLITNLNINSADLSLPERWISSSAHSVSHRFLPLANWFNKFVSLCVMLDSLEMV